MPRKRNHLGLPSLATFALAVRLARMPLVVRLGWAVAALTTLGGIVLAIVLARTAEDAALPSLVSVASSAFAYGSGILIAFGGATQAFRRDRDEGIRALLAARGTGSSEYLVARTLGLAFVVGAATVGGTAITGLAAVAAAGRLGVAGETLRSLVAALAFATTFSGLVTLVALAALGARSRAGGYLVLVALFVVPDVLSPWTSHVVPDGWSRLVSLPGALAAFREGLSPTTLDVPLSVRAAAVLLACFMVLGGLVRAELLRLESEGAR